MLTAGSTFKGFAIEAKDGRIGAINDLLFDDQTWKVRWLIVDTGGWLPGRQVLIHPSAILQENDLKHELHVSLTKAQVAASPSIFEDQPVSRQMELHLYDYYGWDPMWGASYFGASPNAIAAPFSSPPQFGGTVMRDASSPAPPADSGDPHLRSIAAVTGYHILATDGEIGHVEDFLVDRASLGIRYLIIDTKNWWPGEHVLMSPFAVKEIRWSDRQIQLNVDRKKVKGSPPWNPVDMVGEAYERRLYAYEKRLHEHYEWPGYGWF
jgi:uncharacterized protein YrrD